ncbi:MAG: hypothetical protein K6E91_09095 [Butyrivibrio sp.]|nr:hypothetical protein [Butyrivibrio sp.]
MNMFLALAGSYTADPVEEYNDELLRAGIDPEKLGYMKKSERCRILATAGLNPDDFDF